MKRFLVFNINVILFLLLFFTSVYSYPRFSAYTGDKCADCHVNPQGGGMRNQYGINFAKQNLQFDFLKKYVTKKADFSTQLNKNISIGGDLRLVHVGNENTNAPSTNTFLTMQGDLYVYASVNDYISLYIAPGMQIPNIPAKYEVYGMVNNLPLNSYFRAGRINPTFGVKVVEHRAYNRAELLGTPYSANDGVEFGIAPGNFNLSAGLFNGLNTDFFDKDPKRMFVSSADYTFNFYDSKFNFNLGASFYNNPYNYTDPVLGVKTDADKKAYGGFAKFGILNRIAILSEVDFVENTRLSNMTRGLYGFGELSIIIVKGLEFRSQYEYMKPDRDAGNNRITRKSIGAAVYPLAGLETEAMIRFVTEDTQPNTNEFQVNFHFYF